MIKIVNEAIKKEFLIKFGKHIKELRLQKNISQSKLAEKCYTNIKKVGRTERGEYDFQFSSLIVLSKGLDVSIEELLNFEYPKDIFDNFWIEVPIHKIN